MKRTFNDYIYYIKESFRIAFKKIFHQPLYSNEQDTVFKRLNCGDLVYAKVPGGPKEYIDVPEGHRIRPYLVVHKNNEYLYTYYCTTHPNKKLKERQYYRLKRPHSRTFVVLKKITIIKREDIVGFLAHVDPEEQMDINRLVCINRNRDHNNNLLNLSVPTKILAGTIIKLKKHYYYIYKNKANVFYCYELFKSDPHSAYIRYRIGDSFNYVDVKNLHKFTNVALGNLYQICDFEEVLRFKRFISKYDVDRNHLYGDYELRYKCGTLFNVIWSDETLVYLYTYNNKDYGTKLEDCEESIFHVYNIDLANFQMSDVLTNDSLIDLLNELIKNNPTNSNIFKDIIKNLKIAH